jgi:hypothetical protein
MVDIRHFPEGDWPDHGHGLRGSWHGGKTEKGRTALFCCPKCSTTASLSKHTIAESGAVLPSVVCPNKECDFHEFIHLEGWRP